MLLISSEAISAASSRFCFKALHLARDGGPEEKWEKAEIKKCCTLTGIQNSDLEMTIHKTRPPVFLWNRSCIFKDLQLANIQQWLLSGMDWCEMPIWLVVWSKTDFYPVHALQIRGTLALPLRGMEEIREGGRGIAHKYYTFSAYRRSILCSIPGSSG